VGVKPADPDQVVNGFIGKWPTELGERPALWIPASSVSEARLEAAAGAQTVSDSRSLVTSPVLLAIRPQLKAALAQQNWGTLPDLQTNPTALDSLNLPGWGPLRLSLPLSGDSDASYLAAEAVAAASAPTGAPASAGAGAVNTLVGGQPKLSDTKASTAMDALLNATDPATAPVHAVVTTEQQLFQRATSLSDATNKVASWLPPGPTAMADYPTVLLSGNWLSQEQVSAASEFARFMRKPEQLAELAKAGFRTEGGTPPKSDVTSFAPVSAPLSVGDAATRATLANTLTAPADNPAVTIMLDQSMPTDEGGKSRLANVVAALNARLQALPPNSAVGLWTFDGTEGRSEVSTGPLSDPVNGQPRSAALTSTLNSQDASAGGAVSFTTLRLLYTDMMANYRQGQNNSILVITAGPHTDQSLDGAGLQQYIRGAFDQARPVAVNVIDFGNDSDRATWEAVSQTSGGTYQNLASSAGSELSSAIATLLG
jgi:Bacterial extracellular solute-binding protein